MTDFLDDLPDLDLPAQPPRKPKPRRLAPDAIEYVRPHCPRCGSTKIPVYNSEHLPVRYHKCSACGHTFKSIEVNYRPDGPET
jgi:predicted Zn-ribbon and HTH transcriptional regulator